MRYGLSNPSPFRWWPVARQRISPEQRRANKGNDRHPLNVADTGLQPLGLMIDTALYVVLTSILLHQRFGMRTRPTSLAALNSASPDFSGGGGSSVA